MLKDYLASRARLLMPCAVDLSDHSTNPITLQSYGGVSFVTNMPEYGGAAYFNSVGGQLVASGAKLGTLSGDNVSLEFVFYLTQLSGLQCFFDGRNQSYLNRLVVYMNGASFVAVIGGYSLTSTVSIQANTLYRVSLGRYRDPVTISYLRYYLTINESRVHSTTSNPTVPFTLDTIEIGSDYIGTAQVKDGWISDIRLYAGCRDASKTDQNWDRLPQTRLDPTPPTWGFSSASLSGAVFDPTLRTSRTTGMPNLTIRLDYIGPGYIRAFVQKPSQSPPAVRCRVRCVDQRSGMVLETRDSDPVTGEVVFWGLPLDRTYSLEAVDPAGVFRNAFARNITPAV